MNTYPTLLRDLQDCIKSGRAIPVVGAGVTIAATSGQAKSWVHLLESGIDRISDLEMTLPVDWIRIVSSLIETGDSEMLLAAAELVTQRLGGISAAEFARWVDDEFCGLEVFDDSLITSMAEWNVPIATTNYDTLIEKVTGWEGISWREPGRMQEAINKRSPAVLHLHGIWTDPRSVVLGTRSYDALLGKKSAKALESSLAYGTSLVFTGFGAGLSDPNFTYLRRWITRRAPAQRHRHFVLCRDLDNVVVSGRHRRHDDRVFPVAYGKSYEDLPRFLSMLLSEVMEPGNDGRVRAATTTAKLKSSAPRTYGDRRQHMVLQQLKVESTEAHYVRTVKSPVKLAKISDLLSRDENQVLDLTHGTKARIWGLKTTYRSEFDRIEVGDYILFHNASSVFAAARVVYRWENLEASLRLWGVDKYDNSTYPLLMSLHEWREADFPLRSLREMANNGRFPTKPTDVVDITDDVAGRLEKEFFSEGDEDPQPG